MARLITAPEEYLTQKHEKAVFVAGGITGCPEWQRKFYFALSHVSGVYFYNPRRSEFDIGNTDMAEEQIKWEFKYLNHADVIVFWFPVCQNSVCPITLYELGRWVNSGKQILVGAHPDYERKFDLRMQMQLAEYSYGVPVSSFETFVADAEKLLLEI